MRRQAIKRPNPYLNQGITHKPAYHNSPYQKTLKKMFENQPRSNITPIILKNCTHCSNKVKLSHNGLFEQSKYYPVATGACGTCELDICDHCSRPCQNCQNKVCYVCVTSTVYQNHMKDLCPYCATENSFN